MNIAVTAFIIIGGAAPALAGMASLLRMVYRRGVAAGEEKARREAERHVQAEERKKILELERLVAELRAEQASTQPRRRPRDLQTKVIRWDITHRDIIGMITRNRSILRIALQAQVAYSHAAFR